MNIERVQARAESKGIPQPEFRFDTVITDKTILGIEDLVRLGLTHGITTSIRKLVQRERY